jgi:hypothetical protein
MFDRGFWDALLRRGRDAPREKHEYNLYNQGYKAGQEKLKWEASSGREAFAIKDTRR